MAPEVAALTRRSLMSCLTAAVAAPRAALARPGDAITVPLRLAGGRVLMDISLDDGPAQSFLLDTGGIISLVRTDVALAARLTPIGTLNLGTIGGYGGSDPRPGFEARTIVIGGIARRGPVRFAAVDPRQLTLGAAGSLDGEVLTAYDSLLSFGEARWTIFVEGEADRTGFLPVPSTIAQPAKRGSPFLYVEGELDGHPVRLLVDTGAPRSIILQADAARRTGLLDERRSWTPWRVHPGTVPGAIGREVRADRFTIAGQRFDRPIVSLRSNTPVPALADGFLGLGIIERLDWIVDRKGARLWVRPNTRQPTTPPYNRSGLLLASDAKGAIVLAVGTGSPAAQAGVRPGDRVVGDVPVDRQGAITGPAGRKISVTLDRGGQQTPVAVTLTDFL